jgi:hypothetical protein
MIVQRQEKQVGSELMIFGKELWCHCGGEQRFKVFECEMQRTPRRGMLLLLEVNCELL